MGNMLRHGVEMYKQTMTQGKDTPVLIKETRKNESLTRIPAPIPTPAVPSVQSKPSVPTVPSPPEPKYRRVAKFLILIGSEQAAEILAELDPQQVEKISQEIAFIKTIKPEEGKEIIAEFQDIFSKTGAGKPYGLYGSSQGGVEAARRILYAAKGPEKGEELLNRAIPESKENLFSFLEEFSAEQLGMLLKEESDQTAALILSRMPAKLSAGVLGKLLPGRRAEVLKRIAKQKEVAPEVLEQVTAALKEKVRHIAGGSKDITIDGMQTLAAILKQGDYSFSDKLLGELEDEDPEIGRTLKERLYTLDDIVDASDRPIQDKLKTMSEYDIALLIKGRSKEFSEKILSNISAGRRQIIREETEILGAVPKRDCDSAARDFLVWFRFARENGDILLTTDEDVVV